MFVLFEMERTKVSESETVLMVDVYRHGPMKNPLFLKVKDVPGNAIRRMSQHAYTYMFLDAIL